MILLYHKVDCAPPASRWWVTVDSFYRQLLELKSKHVVSLDDYDPTNALHTVITFDGVYENVVRFAVPLLKTFGYPFEAFVTGDYVGRDNEFDAGEPAAKFATAEQLRQIVAAGGRLQWHTNSHKRMDSLSASEFERELEIPDALKDLDAEGFKWFAYPHGTLSETNIEKVKRKFLGALSVDQGNDTDRFRFNRVIVENESRLPGPRISTIVPSYNYGAFLLEAVESLLRQTRLPDEILIINDASTDNTDQIASTIARKDSRIRYVRNETNLGIIGTFNKALSLTSGEYVCFLGADNRFRSDYIEKTAALLDSDPKMAIAYTDMALFGPRAQLAATQFFSEFQAGSVADTHVLIRFPDFTETTRQRMTDAKNVMHGSSMYRRQAFSEVGGYRSETHPEDFGLFQRMLQQGWGAGHVAEPVLEYRQHSHEQANSRHVSYSELLFFRKLAAELEAERHKLSSLVSFYENRPLFHQVVKKIENRISEKGVVKGSLHILRGLTQQIWGRVRPLFQSNARSS